LEHNLDNYYGCCGGVELAADVPTDFGQYISDIARKIWETKQTITTDPVIIKAYGERLEQAVKKGYDVEIDFKTPDGQLAYQLQNNVWQFSAAKTYTQLKDMSAALLRPDGTLRNFSEFRAQIGIITKKQIAWLKTEYNLAVAGSQMAGKWQQIQAQKEQFPYLQFEAVDDNHTTQLCNNLDGVILPVDDPFWMTYYPPNHYNCRSTVRQLRKGKITPMDKIVYPSNMPSLFKVNLGERGLVFPEDHAYYKDMPDEVKNAARSSFPYDLQFDILHEDKGVVRQHFMVDTKTDDYERLLKIAVEKTKDIDEVIDILPALNPNKYAAQRQIIFPDAKEGTSPDLRINKVLWEEEGSYKSGNINNISGAVGSGAKQANYVIVTLSDNIEDGVLKRVAGGRFKTHKNLMHIEFRLPNGTVKTFIKAESQ
jgi:SPP1 gp7 family putative phage head morphogenesis protein